jgi:hypothetical protein
MTKKGAACAEGNAWASSLQEAKQLDAVIAKKEAARCRHCEERSGEAIAMTKEARRCRFPFLCAQAEEKASQFLPALSPILPRL